MRYLSSVEVVSENLLVILCNYIFRLSKKTKTGEDNFYQSATRNIGRTVLQDKVSGHFYERRSCHEDKSTRIPGSGKKDLISGLMKSFILKTCSVAVKKKKRRRMMWTPIKIANGVK